jgi:transposase-like protein
LSALEQLQAVRWPNGPQCPYCRETNRVSYHVEKGRLSRWQCWPCGSSFSVTTGTVFSATRVKLQLWFEIIRAVGNGQPVNASAMARDWGTRTATVRRVVRAVAEALRKRDPLVQDLLKSWGSK